MYCVSRLRAGYMCRSLRWERRSPCPYGSKRNSLDFEIPRPYLALHAWSQCRAYSSICCVSLCNTRHAAEVFWRVGSGVHIGVAGRGEEVLHPKVHVTFIIRGRTYTYLYYLWLCPRTVHDVVRQTLFTEWLKTLCTSQCACWVLLLVLLVRVGHVNALAPSCLCTRTVRTHTGNETTVD